MAFHRGPWTSSVAALAAACGLASCSTHAKLRSVDADVPVATVQQSDLQLKVHTTGELRATHTVMLDAPAIGGGTLQIVRLLKSGTPVKAGNVVIQFDPSQQEYNLAQNRSDFEQAEQEIVKAKDDAAVQVAEDKTALLKAKFAVRQAELDVSKNDIVSAIDAQKNLLTLDEQKRALAQLEEDIKSHASSNQATIAVDEQKRNKAKLAMEEAQNNIEKMRVRSPISGLVVVQENMNATGGFYFGGMTLPPYQEGDQVNAGSPVAQVIDTGEMEIGAKIGEGDRANVKVGQKVQIRVDALPAKTFYGTVKSVGGMVASPFVFDSDSAHKYDVNVAFDHSDPQLRPGFSAHLTILGSDIPNAMSIPREAIFEQGGSSAIYVRTGSRFEQRSVKIRYLTEALAIVDGLKKGTEVALVNPEQVTGAAQGRRASSAARTSF